MKSKTKYYAELTDTFGGEANYSWLKHFIISANTLQGAIGKLSKEIGLSFKIDFHSDTSRYNVKSAAICAFVEEDSNYCNGAIPQHVKQI